MDSLLHRFTWCAHPEYYDFFHTIEFGSRSDDNDVAKFSSGSGQCISLIAMGGYSFKNIQRHDKSLRTRSVLVESGSLNFAFKEDPEFPRFMPHLDSFQKVKYN